jgi:hypothetical protein
MDKELFEKALENLRACYEILQDEHDPLNTDFGIEWELMELCGVIYHEFTEYPSCRPDEEDY